MNIQEISARLAGLAVFRGLWTIPSWRTTAP